MNLEITCKSLVLCASLNDYCSSIVLPNQEHYLKAVDAEDFRNYILENERTQLYEALSELYAEPETCGDLNYCTIRQVFIEKTKENILNHSDQYEIRITELGTSGNDGTSLVISGSDILLDLLDEESELGEFDAQISGYVEGCLRKYVEAGRWHWGVVQPDGTTKEMVAVDKRYDIDVDKFFLWFGPDGEPPIEKWTIHPGSPVPPQWFESYESELLYILVDEIDGCFDTWFCFECGCVLPDMEQILNNCPIRFEEGDSEEIVTEKFIKAILTLAEEK